MFTNLSAQAQRERDAIVAEIYIAFAEISLSDCAISWSECLSHDCPDEPVDPSEKHGRWTDLVDNETWEPFPGLGGFCFINAEGLQYYLPPTMIRFLRGKNTEWYPGHLLSHIDEYVSFAPGSPWSEQQLRCIARFISFMARHDREEWPTEDDPNPWFEALELGWSAYLPGQSEQG